MRIISQSGMIDIPYERSAVVLTQSPSTKSWIIMAYFDNKSFMMATYSTKQQAQFVFERLHSLPNDYYYLPLDEKETWKGLDYVTSEST